MTVRLLLMWNSTLMKTDESNNKRPLRPLKSVAGRTKSARPKAGRYV